SAVLAGGTGAAAASPDRASSSIADIEVITRIASSPGLDACMVTAPPPCVRWQTSGIRRYLSNHRGVRTKGQNKGSEQRVGTKGRNKASDQVVSQARVGMRPVRWSRRWE